MAACRLASKGKTLADSSFSSEVQSIQSFLAMQKTTPSNNTAQTDESINTHSLVSPRYQKKYKPKQVPRFWVIGIHLNWLITTLLVFSVAFHFCFFVPLELYFSFPFSPIVQLAPRILEAYQNVAQLSLTDAIQKFLQIWQALPDFGLAYIVVRWV